jgi:hypothetical protein
MSTSENTAKRKARVQISFAARAAMERAKPAVGDGSIYNIYYGKYYIEGWNFTVNLTDMLTFRR